MTAVKNFFKQTGFIALLTAVCVLIAGGMLFLAIKATETEVNNLSDINGLFGSSQGFSNIDQQKETNSNGASATTITMDLKAEETEILQHSLQYLVDNLNTASNGETVNITVNITGAIGGRLEYKALTSKDYEDKGYFTTKILPLFETLPTSGVEYYNLTSRPNNTGRFNVVDTGVIDYDFSGDKSTNEFYALYTAQVENSYRTFINEQGEDTVDFTFRSINSNLEKPVNIELALNAVFNTETSKINAVNDQTKIEEIIDISANRNNWYSGLGAIKAVYTQLLNPNASKLVITLPEQEAASVNSKVNDLKNLKKWSYGKIQVPNAKYDISFVSPSGVESNVLLTARH